MDGLMVWRCIRISNTFDHRLVRWIVICTVVPLCIVSIVLGSIFIAGQAFWDIAFICVSFALNVVATGFAVFRLFLFRHHLVQVLGKGHGSLYRRIGIILVESAALYSLFIILLLVPYASNTVIYAVFSQMLPQIQAISSLLIIMRVMRKREHTRAGADSEKDAGTIIFRPRLGEGSAPSESTVSAPTHNAVEVVLTHDVHFTDKD